MSQETALLQKINTRIQPDVLSRFGPANIYAFGVSGGRTNWRINREDSKSFQKIVDVLPSDIKKVWMPIPTDANGIIATSTAFKNQFSPGTSSVTFMGGCRADGCIVPKGEVFALTSADCATVVAHSSDKKLVVAAHAGRDSVLDRNALLGKFTKVRKNFGVVESIITTFKQEGYDPENIFLGVYAGIRSNFLHLPNHEEYGLYNQKLIKFCKNFDGALINEATGAIDIYQVIRGLAEKRGIPSQHIFFDNIDSGEKGQTTWASHRHNTTGVPMRTLVAVHHT